MKARVAALALVLAAGVAAASPGSLWVARSGDDSRDCSRDAPCASLAHAVDAAMPGDTVTVAAEGDSAWLRAALLIASHDATRFRGLLAPGRGRRRIGFVRLATTWATELRPAFPAAALAIPNLAEALNRWTGVAAAVDKHLFIGTPEFQRAPFVFLTTERAFELTDAEAQALGDYLRGGGFVLADNATADLFEHGQAEASLRQAFRQALGRKGRLVRVPNGHPVFHCFYEFSSPPPGLAALRPSYYLEGVFLEGRLAALLTDSGYVHSWALNNGNEAQLRFGINAVIYALSQAGPGPWLHFRVQP